MIRTPKVLVAAAAASLAVLAVVPAAAGASTPRGYGRIASAQQHRDGSLTVTGYLYDRTNSSRSVSGCIAVHGKCFRVFTAKRHSATFDRTHHITGRHAFGVHIGMQQPGVTVSIRGFGHALDSAQVATVGSRVVKLAKRYVGTTPYSYGGTTPKTGFDCSGYARYLYQHAKVATLPHNSESQRHTSHMRRISSSAARPGDLVFYLAGGSAYHVAVYAGHGKQYSAADPQDGIKYQKIWASNVEFRTDWH